MKYDILRTLKTSPESIVAEAQALSLLLITGPGVPSRIKRVSAKIVDVIADDNRAIRFDAR